MYSVHFVIYREVKHGKMFLFQKPQLSFYKTERVLNFTLIIIVIIIIRTFDKDTDVWSISTNLFVIIPSLSHMGLLLLIKRYKNVLYTSQKLLATALFVIVFKHIRLIVV